MNKKRNIGILIFKNVEVLDFAGPFEVFSVSSEKSDLRPFNVFTVAEKLAPIRAKNGLSVNPTYDFNNCPQIDLLIIAGGFGTKNLMTNQRVLDWIFKIHLKTEFTLSICSGARLLGVLGLLDNQPYCTHHEVYEHLKEIVPTGKPQKDLRFVRSGKIYTSSGISAGIDLSFEIVQKIVGEKAARDTANYMEYHWKK